MRVVYHPDFPKEIKSFEAQYFQLSQKLAQRFRADIDDIIEKVKTAPSSAGHFLNTGSTVVKEVRRRNLSFFPFFILYAVQEDLLIFRSIIPSSSDPLTGLKRFRD